MDAVSALAQDVLLHGCHAVVPQGEDGALAGPWLGAALSGPIERGSTAEPFVWSTEICRSSSSLVRTLQGSAGLSGGAALIPIPLLKIQTSFLESLQSTTFSVSLVVQARRVLATYEVSEAGWDGNRPIPADPAALDAFVAEYGDSWVRAVAIGGSLQGVYTLFAQSQAQAQEVGTALEALVAAGGVSLGPSFAQRLKTMASNQKVNSSFRLSIAGLSHPPALDESTVEDFARQFGTLELDQPEVLSCQVWGYEKLADLRDGFAPVAANRRLFCGDGAAAGLLSKRQALLEIENQCRWIKGTYQLYGLAEDPSLAVHGAQVKAERRSIDQLCAHYQQSPSTPLAEPALGALAVGSPRLEVQISNGEGMGGGGGDPFAYPDRENAIRRRRRLVEVGLRSGGRIDQLRLRYHQEPSGGVDEWINERHGSDSGGRDQGVIELGSGVGISRIDAKTGVPNGRVDKLALTSSDGQQIGGGGEAGNKELHWQAAANQVLLGFSGRSKAELDSLCSVIATFSPLVWEPVEVE